VRENGLCLLVLHLLLDCVMVIGNGWRGGSDSSSIRSGLAQRARIVLLAADGVSNTDIDAPSTTPAIRKSPFRRAWDRITAVFADTD